jgi:acetyltransferase-like isoleucine patch superfamily enzyme
VDIVSPQHVSIGDRCWIDDNVTLMAGPPAARPHMKRIGPARGAVAEGRLEVGHRVHIAANVVVQAHGGVAIGDELTLAAGSKVFSLSHHYRNPDDPDDTRRYIFGGRVDGARQFLLVGPVVLERGTAVGLNAVVLPGTRLREYSWLATASVLTGDTPRGAVLRGDPARAVKRRPGFGEAGTGEDATP